MKEIILKEIESKIYIIRNKKVMIDNDLAKLYGVETSALNRQVKRNYDRFPNDFIFQLTKDEYENLRCQFGISSLDYGGRRYQPFVFTENCIAMLSSVLRSKQAIQVNIAIMRIFTKLRSFLMLEKELSRRMDDQELNTTKVFKVLFERLSNLENQLPSIPKNRKKIGFKSSTNYPQKD